MKRFLCRFGATRGHDEAPGSTAWETAATTQTLEAPPPRRAVLPCSLVGGQMPSLFFNNFDRRFVDLGEIARSGLVLYVYPGCPHTPTDGSNGLQADAAQHRAYCCLRERFAELMPGGAMIALSSISPTQQFHNSPELAWEQNEEAIFEHYLISDEMLQLAEELGLPTFQHEGETHYERLTLLVRGGRIQCVFHPVTPGQDARQALAWLALH